MDTAVSIPPRLVELVAARRVIPFVGAGFSAAMNLPDWDGLLKKLSEELESDLTYEQVKDFCDGDYLQIAEYYFLISDHRIGPLRHAIATSFSGVNDTMISAPHVELVNLGAPQIYTTNYDDLIEKTYKSLRLPVEVIALPRDVATASGTKTQVVKYHGDLRHEQTLVLTESSYYGRLDLDSPMDLKFRSDLLGRSVLFMGYSFKDINIRIIWFKLMSMMKDVALEDRPTSYIVTFKPNPVRERLYDEVGLKTICLDPKGECKSSQDKAKILGQFLMTLATQAAENQGTRGTPNDLFYSKAVTEHIEDALTAAKLPSPRRFAFAVRNVRLNNALLVASHRKLVPTQKNEILGVLQRVGENREWSGLIALVEKFLQQFGGDPLVTSIVARALRHVEGREPLQASNILWSKVWEFKISVSDATKILDHFSNEILRHSEGDAWGLDHDLAYCADLAKRIQTASLVPSEANELRGKAQELLKQAAKKYPSVATIETAMDSMPNPYLTVEEINHAQESSKDSEPEF